MNKLCKVILALILIVVIAAAVYIANGLFGNPVSKYLATKCAEEHLEEAYGECDFLLDEVVFNFKTGAYYAYVSSPSSIDSSFTLAIAQNGELIFDDYSDRVTSGWNTARRIDDEYRALTLEIIDGEAFPYDAHIGFGEIVFVSREHIDNYTPSYALITEDLILDGEYDATEMGAIAGCITLYVYSEEVTAENLAQMLLDIKEAFDKGGVDFYAIKCILENEGNNSADSQRIEVMNFLYSDIYEDGLIERVIESNDRAREYYEEQTK